MATGPIETHLHRSFNWENGAPGARMGPRGRSASCGNGLFTQCVRLRSEINLKWGGFATVMHCAVRTCPGSDKMVHGKTMQGGAYGN